jgi:hypothetical protein
MHLYSIITKTANDWFHRETPPPVKTAFSSDPVGYWSDVEADGVEWIPLAGILKRFFARIHSEVPCERHFSKMGILVGTRRQSLSKQSILAQLQMIQQTKKE